MSEVDGSALVPGGMSSTRYELLQADVAAVFAAEDPLGLVESGAPANEYDLEVNTVLPRLPACSSVDDVQRVIVEEFVRWFGSSGPAERYRSAAGRVWVLWQEARPNR